MIGQYFINPDPISAGAVYEYENGVTNGTVKPNNTDGYTKHWLDGEQVRNLKEQYSRGPISRIKGVLQRGR